ncbi:MAG: hypothetical protein Q9210_005034, partial [Variospora velana]
MAVELDQYPNEDSDFAQMRESLMPAQQREKLLNIALFDNSLRTTSKHGVIQTLMKRRKTLPDTVRAIRKKGVVPVYVSLAWFVFSLALSIEDAVGRLGDNQIAHNLAIGLLLAWLPCFLIATIVDRNPVSAHHVRRKLNDFMEETRLALLDPVLRKSFLSKSQRNEADLAWTSALDVDDFYRDGQGFFTRFAGQGSIRWHYGVAYPILAAIESPYVAASGRGWLADSNAARAAIVWGPIREQGLIWFDPRMIWQISSSSILVGGTVFGAFILS